MRPHVPETSIAELRSRYSALLLDAYGVLVDADRALPGAAELIRDLNRVGPPYFVLTNDASRSPEASSARYRRLGIDVPPERVITSGSILSPYFLEHQLSGIACLVLGPEDACGYVREAGGRVVPFDQAHEDPTTLDALIVADESGFPFLEGIDLALSVVLDNLDRGRPLRLIVPNPDLIYPKSEGRFGFAAGTIARMIEGALRLRHPGRKDITFTALGKPHRAIFAEAERRAQTRDLVMIGDQLETDIRGAKGFGIDAALVTYGITRALDTDGARPDYLLEDLSLP